VQLAALAEVLVKARLETPQIEARVVAVVDRSFEHYSLSSTRARPLHSQDLFAIRDVRAVLTLNRRDFLQLHRDLPAHAGLVLCTVDLDFVGQALRIHEAVSAAPDLRGQVLRVNRPPR
jgi:hypothetical protein